MNGSLFRTGVALLLLAVSTANAEDAAEAQDCRLKQYGSIDLMVNGDVLLPVALDGKSGLMTLHFASAFSVIWKHAAEEWALRRRRLSEDVEVRFADQRVRHTTRIESLVLGTVNFGKSEFLIAPEPAEYRPSTVLPNVGLIGIDLFSSVDFELDLARRKLNIFSQDHCPGQVVYWSADYASAPFFRGPLGNLYFPMELEGKKVEASIAPANDTTTLHTDVTRRLWGFDESSTGVDIKPDSGSGKSVAHYRAMQITAPGLKVSNVKIQLLPARKECGIEQRGRKGGAAGYDDQCIGAFPMLIGRNVLEKLRIYFATKEKKLYFTLADAT